MSCLMMEIELEDYCTCGHIAAFHDDEVSEHVIPRDKAIELIKVVKKYQKCGWKSPQDPYGYTNFNREVCFCEVFKLDNLRFLERKSDA